MCVWPYFQTWLPFLDIRRSETPILHQKIGLFLAIKITCWWYSTENVQILQSYKAAMCSHPIQTKNNGIIFVVQILARELYIHVLRLIFSKWNPRYYGNGRTFASKNLWNANKYGIYQFPRIRAKSVIFDFPRYYWPMLDAYSQLLLISQICQYFYRKNLRVQKLLSFFPQKIYVYLVIKS